MGILDTIAWCGFVTYTGGVLLFAAYLEVQRFFNDDPAIFDTYSGRSGMYIDYLRE